MQAHTPVGLLDMVHHVVHLTEIQDVTHVTVTAGVTTTVVTMMTAAVTSTRRAHHIHLIGVNYV